MELKLSNKKRFFVRVSKHVKEDLKYLNRKVRKVESNYRGKCSYNETTIMSYENNCIEDYIVDESNIPTFSKLVKNIMNEKGMTSKDIYKNSLINRKLFSALNVNDEYIPSRETAIMYCLALKLSYSESERLMKSAGYCFYEYSNFDIIIKYCIDNKIFNIDKVNDALYYYTRKCLGYR